VLEQRYGVRIAVDPEELDPPPPSDPRELAALSWTPKNAWAPSTRSGSWASLRT
jgi:hypothetical protein